MQLQQMPRGQGRSLTYLIEVIMVEMMQKREEIFKFLIEFLLNQLEEEHLGLKRQVINELEKEYNINIDEFIKS